MPTEGLEKLNVLIADDTDSIRNITRSILREMGFNEVEAVSDGVEALKYLEARPFHLVIADWDMPGKNGIELLQAIKQLPDDKRPAAYMMMTGTTEREKVMTAIKAGIHEYVAKPFSPDILEQKVLTLLRRLTLIPNAPEQE